MPPDSSSDDKDTLLALVAQLEKEFDHTDAAKLKALINGLPTVPINDQGDTVVSIIRPLVTELLLHLFGYQRVLKISESYADSYLVELTDLEKRYAALLSHADKITDEWGELYGKSLKQADNASRAAKILRPPITNTNTKQVLTKTADLDSKVYRYKKLAEINESGLGGGRRQRIVKLMQDDGWQVTENKIKASLGRLENKASTPVKH